MFYSIYTKSVMFLVGCGIGDLFYGECRERNIISEVGSPCDFISL